MTRFRYRFFQFIALALLLLQPIWSQGAQPSSAKISNIILIQPFGLTRFIFEITNGTFHYQWKLSSGKQQLQLRIDNAVLATTLPKSGLSATPINDYQIRPQQGASSVLLVFQLKTAVDVKTYALPAFGGHEPCLILDLKPRTKAAPVLSPSTVIKPTKPTKSTTVVTTSTTATKPITKKLTSVAPKATTVQTPLSLPQERIANTPKKTLTSKISGQPIMVVIDPGHGGKDSGAVGPGKTREKDVVLAISKLLQQQFKQQAGFNVELTRSHDVFIPLHQRLDIARQSKADIFIAIHADAAYENENITGASVFALSERGATSEGARWLAQQENNSELIHGIVVEKDKLLRSVLLDLSLTHTISVSLDVGQSILSKLATIAKLHNGRVEQAAFVVLKSPDIPSLLIETGYISNPIEERKLNNPAYQQQLANAITQGVVDYFAQHPREKMSLN